MPRRGWRGNDKLILSLGSWLLPLGPPEGLAFSPSGTFLLRDALPVVPCWRRLVHYTPAACDPPTAGVRLPSPLVQGFVIGVLSESKKGKETRKETNWSSFTFRRRPFHGRKPAK